MISRRNIIKAIMASFMATTNIDSVLGNEILYKNKKFEIDNFPLTISTLVSIELVRRDINKYNGSFLPIFGLDAKNENDFFVIEVSVSKADFYTDALNLAGALAGIGNLNNPKIDEKRSNFGHAVIDYDFNTPDKKLGRLYTFKVDDKFLIIHVGYKNDLNYSLKYKLYEDNFMKNLRINSLEDKKVELNNIEIDDNFKILLPYDWEYKEVTKKARKLYDPKGRMTTAYHLQHKKRQEQLPYIIMAHYQDDAVTSEYLLDVFKNEIMDRYNNDKNIKVESVDLSGNNSNNKNTRLSYLDIKLSDKENQSLPMQSRVILLPYLHGEGSYIIYTTGATVKDYRMNEVEDLNLVSAWMTIDAIGTSMDSLLFHSLFFGLDNDSSIFDYRLK